MDDEARDVRKPAAAPRQGVWRGLLSAHGLGCLTEVTLILAVLCLLAGVVLLVPWIFQVRDGEVTALPGLIALGMLTGLVVSEWPRVRVGAQVVTGLMRALIVGGALLWLGVCLFLPRAVRQALETDHRVLTTDTRVLSEFESGVLTLAQSVAVDMSEAFLPILILLTAALLPTIRRVYHLWKQKE